MSFRFCLLILALMGTVSCGQGTEPLSALGDPTQAQGPGLGLPISSSIALTTFTPFSSTNDGFDLIPQSTFWTTGNTVTIVAPASGLVVDVNTTSGSVSIMHNVNVISKITGLTSSVQVGNYVQGGATIGSSTSIYSKIHFSVYVNGAAVCPLSYLSSTGRAQMQTTIYGSIYSSNPCLQ